MERAPEQILQDALALPAEARAALVDSLISSLDPTVDADAEESWRREIYRRLQESDTEAVHLVSWEEARLSLRSRLEQ